MKSLLNHKQILLGVTGSIAAYKSADLVRRLREAGATVRVVMTENAQRFITPLTMQAVSGFPVHEELFDLQAEAAMGHIELARFADLIVVAPATADFMGRLANGLADDLLTTLCLAANAPIVLAPAMNQGMWRHVLTQDNLQALEQKGVTILGPIAGSQACGDMGPGRMMEPIDIVHALNELFAHGPLSGKRVLVTAGPTHEAIDPIRFISNGSSGKMGYALAQAAASLGAEVTLISGPTHLPKPKHMTTISVVSAQEMYDAVMAEIAETDIFLSVAAVSDYRPTTYAPQKIHKHQTEMDLKLTRNPDIVASVAKLKNPPFIVGFAAETESLNANAQTKREQKKLDMIVANLIAKGVGMGADENTVTVFTKTETITFPMTTKHKLAQQLIELIAKEFKENKTNDR